MNPNALDWIVYVLAAAACIIGYRRGFAAQLVSLLSLFVAWLTAYFFYDDAAHWVGKLVPVEAFVSYTKYEFIVRTLKIDRYVVNALSFLLIFLLVKIGLVLAGHVLSLIAKVPGLNALNRFGGALLALLETTALLLIAVHAMAILPSDGAQRLLAGSQAAQWLIGLTPSLWEALQSLPRTISL